METRSHRLALSLSLVLIALHIGLFGSNLDSPGIFRFDEFLTVDRSLGFLRTGDLFTVYTNCEPCWIKPPLHFYLGAATIKAGLQPVEAVRLWSVVFAGLSLWLVCLLTLGMAPDAPWCAPAAVIFCSSSVIFAEYTRCAMMETGYVFFILLSIYGAFRAGEDPRLWLLWALGCGLGALQRAPVAWALSSIWIYGLYRSGHLPGPRELLRERWFRLALGVNILLTLSWPVIQTVLYGPNYRRIIVSRWIFRMTRGMERNENVGMRFDLEWLEWLKDDSVLFWLVATATLLFIAARPAWREKHCLWLLAPSIPIMAAFTFCGGPFHSRYILTFVPLFCISTAILLSRILKRTYAPLLLSVVVFFSSGAELARAPYVGTDQDVFDLRSAGRRLASNLEDDETPVFVVTDDLNSSVYGIEGMTRPFKLSGSAIHEGENVLLVLVRSTEVSQIEQSWPGSLEVVESVGRFSIVRLVPATPEASEQKSRRI